MNIFGLIETLWQDVRYGARVLRKTPGFTMVAILSLALGIGATTAIFSVVYGVLVSPYPYARPGEIWAPLIRDVKRPQQSGFSMHQARDYVEIKKLPAFAETMATLPENRLLTGDRPPESFQSISVTANGFQFLGVPPVLGRTILPSDLKPDGQPEPVVVLSFKAWQRLFDGSTACLGKTLLLNDQPFTVIGVMPPRFGWWTDEGGWLVLPEDSRDRRMAAAIMRLKPGVTPQVAEAQLQALHLRLAHDRPDDFPKAGFTTSLQNYLDITAVSSSMKASLRLLFGAVGFLMLIACANVANLQLARGTARGHEIAVRMSVGAGRARLFRQLLTESLVLSAVGGAGGVLLGYGITRAIILLIPAYYLPNEARIDVNNWVLLFSACVSVATGIVFGLAPALKCSRPHLVDALKDAGRTSSGSGSGSRTRQVLVVAEIALSVVLLMGASLAIRGFQHVQGLDAGFQTDHVLMVGLQLAPKRYATYEQRNGFAGRVLAAAAELPGVQSAAIGNGGLPFGGPRSGYTIEGQPKVESETMMLTLTSPDYPGTMGIALRAGRLITPAEVANAVPVALINETAGKLWPAGTSPIGARVRLDLLEKPPGALLVPKAAAPVVTVVGILADTRNAGLRNPPVPGAYLPYTLAAPPGRTLALRTQGPPMLLLNALRARVRELDKDQPITRPLTLDEVLGSETAQPRFNMALFTFFGMLGLALAAVGIYSMLSYAVARRTHEIGIRMALGASQGSVLGLIVSMGGRLVFTGLAIGIAGSLALARLLRSEVFDVPATDAAALTGVIGMLCAAALAACLLPARRAAKLNPTSALRHE